ncbi:MAG: molybdopterin cofactor-binding domain-containing protein, partial [Sphingomonadales bacterium]
RAALATYSNADGFTLFTGTQGVWGVRATLAGHVFKIPKERLRVVSPDVGGGFGMKGFSYPEYALVMEAARRLGRPVKWTAERAESFLSDSHGRDVVSTVELAFDAGHRITGYRVDSIANLGAYLSEFGPYVPTMAATQILGGVYDIPNLYVRVRSVLTNTPPVDAYRGAGRPEAMHMMECAIDQAARELGISPDELRRINFIQPDQLPYKTALGASFDSGAFEINMDMAMKNAGWAGLKARRESSAAGGRLRGIGMGYYIESTLGMPSEEVELKFSDEGRLTLFVGTQSTGQGHWTTFGQILAERLGLELSEIDMVEGDTARKEKGFGTGGSRSLQMVGNAVLDASDEMIRKGLPAASELLSVPEEDLIFEDGLYRAGATNLTIGLAELARRLGEPDGETGDRAEGLASSATYTKSGPTFPNGCHIAEVEIDRETGAVTLQAYTIVDDFGTVINPLVVEGQVHGGVAQGIGQALTEHCVFDGDDGTLLSGSLLDYSLPRADDLPNFDFTINSTPCTTNPLGMKGCGEAGTVGALPAVMNAVNDALASAGLGPIDMPATPFRVWSHLNGV